jgi:photosystem II stability/assembly factor-like uncharacterized protein
MMVISVATAFQRNAADYKVRRANLEIGFLIPGQRDDLLHLAVNSVLALIMCSTAVRAITPAAMVQRKQLHWTIVSSGTEAQFRGISVVSDTVAWAAGSNGTFGRTIDGNHWTCAQIGGAGDLMFRSVEGFDAEHAVLLAIGPGDKSRILSTADGGKSWKEQWVNPDAKAFYDSLAFWDRLNGIAFSDPVDGQFPLVTTSDGGLTWHPIPSPPMPAALAGEGAFSASGTCLVVSGTSGVWIATGGANVSRVFRSRDRGETWSAAGTPIPAGKETAGIFGLRFANSKKGIAVGGDYKDPEKGSEQVAFTSDGGATWRFASRLFPTGLREAAAYWGRQILVVGPGGCDESQDDGRSWYPIIDGPKGIHTCGTHGAVCWVAGDHGLIAKVN